MRMHGPTSERVGVPDAVGDQVVDPHRRRRGPNLRTVRIAEVVRVIERLPGKPTWAMVTAAVSSELGLSYTRQALNAHAAIRLAYDGRKRGEPALSGARPVSKGLQEARRCAERLRRELAESRVREEALLLKFVVWAYNAHANNVTEAMLEQPLRSKLRD